jgi:poly-gamma-glutamate synthesis protein (capsule biosynthesis protein)
MVTEVAVGQTHAPRGDESIVTPQLRAATLLFGGDVLTHASVVRAACPARGSCAFERLLAPTAALVGRADLAVCHLEVPIVGPGERITGWPTFGAPPQLAQALAATGWDHCSTASNHSIDRGTAGVDSTLDALDGAGITHAGTARTIAEAGAVPIRDVAGVRVAFLSATYGLNGLRLPRGEGWRVGRIDVAWLVARANAAREAGAEVVIASLHWGDEYRHRLTPSQRAVADALTASGAIDLIVGHHAHVVQPIEQVNGRWVVFGLGNHVSGQVPVGRKLATQDGILAEVVVRETAPGAFTVERPVAHPTWNDPRTKAVHVAGELPGSRAASASTARTRRVLGQR